MNPAAVTDRQPAAAATAPPAASPSSAAIEPRIKACAYGLGFDLAGITTLGMAGTAARFQEWVAAGMAGEMQYLERGAEARLDTRRPYAGARSAVVVALDYGGREPSGPVARYARGDDYHDVMVDRLRALHARVRELAGHDVRGKAYVDTRPILERDLARQAGLGWFGKNTMLINPRQGSFFFLGALVLELELAPDAPFEDDRCGSCTRCLDACPTGAFVEARVLDARRCISYLTIELRGEIPVDLRESMGELLYGCDICQDVCPWNRKFAKDLPATSPFTARAALDGSDARETARTLLAMSQDDFSAQFKGSPMKRAKLRGLKRNAAVVLGNIANPGDADVLERALADPEPLVREHSAWALRQLRSRLDPFSL